MLCDYYIALKSFFQHNCREGKRETESGKIFTRSISLMKRDSQGEQEIERKRKERGRKREKEKRKVRRRKGEREGGLETVRSSRC